MTYSESNLTESVFGNAVMRFVFSSFQQCPTGTSDAFSVSVSTSDTGDRVSLIRCERSQLVTRTIQYCLHRALECSWSPEAVERLLISLIFHCSKDEKHDRAIEDLHASLRGMFRFHLFIRNPLPYLCRTEWRGVRASQSSGDSLHHSEPINPFTLTYVRS